VQIHTHRDDEQEDDRSGLVELESVALRLTPIEARDLRSALDRFLAREGKWSEGWHDHIEAWDRSCEIVLLPDFEGTSAEPSVDERVEAHLTRLAAEGASVARAVRDLAQLREVSRNDAKELLREHPAWRDRFGS
jgi:hypothetical protein